MKLGPYQLEIAAEFGPRIISLRHGEGRQQLVTLGPEVALEHDGGVYQFRGGHRLWAAPEIPAITYASDGHRCEVSEGAGMVSIKAPADSAGLVKEIEISLEGEQLVVTHSIRDATGEGRILAAWGITQLPPGGTAVLPFQGEQTAPGANRYLVLWPYTSINDPRLTIGDEAVVLRAVEGPPLKLGAGPAPGRLGYFLDGSLFLKEVESAGNRQVPDFGAAGQVFLGEEFCELESVGELTDLSGGARALLTERWSVVECADIDAAVEMTVGPWDM